MRVIKGKKGQLLLYGLIAGFIAAITLALISSVADKKEFPVIGDSSLRLMGASIKAEKALLYIDQSAKYSVYQSIYDLAGNGGCSEGNKYSGHTLWNGDNSNSEPIKCYPTTESSKNNFSYFFTNNLNNYLSKYEDVAIPLNNYNFDFNNNIFMVIARNSLVVQKEIPPQLGQPDANGIYKYEASGATPIWYRYINNVWQWTPYDPYDNSEPNCWMPVTEITVSNECRGKWDGQKPVKANRDVINYLNEIIVAYSINSSFRIDLGNYDFSDYEEVRERAENLIEVCKDKNPHLCINENVFNIFNDGNFELDVCETEGSSPVFLGYREISGTKYRVYEFCIKNNINKKFYTYDYGKVALRDIVYKFALQFEELPCDNDGYDITKCRELSCGKYYSCESKDICLCPVSQSPASSLPTNACYGDCPLCWWGSWSIGACGGGGCAETDELWTRKVMPSNCVDETQCEFNPCCEDPVCCGEYPPACDCGSDPCCTEDDSLCPPPVPPPTPTPSDSCEGRCGGRAPDGCWCDDSCVDYGDCCGDYYQEC